MSSCSFCRAAWQLHVATSSLALCLILAVSCGEEKADDAQGTQEQEVKKHGLTKDQAGKVLAKIGDKVITVGDFAARLAAQSPYLRARYRSPERKAEFLENMIRFELLALEAKRMGLEELPEVRRQKDKMLIQELFAVEVNEKVRLQDVSKQDVADYYAAHPDEFRKPAQVRASHIRMRNKAKAEQVLAEVLANPQDDAYFREMVSKHSDDKGTRGRGGDLRFFSRPEERGQEEEEIPAELALAAFKLESIGQVYPELVSSPQGFHIVRLTAQRATMQRKLEEVQRVIQHKLWRERRKARSEELVAELRKKAKVREFPEVLDDLKVKED